MSFWRKSQDFHLIPLFVGLLSALSCQPGPLASQKKSQDDSLLKAAPGSSAHCLEEHLQEAIALNTLRQDLYGSLTGGASLVISEQLIESERSLLGLVKPMRPMLKYWWNRDILVTCLEFSAMANTPDFSPQFKTPPPTVSTVLWLDPLKVTMALQKQLLSGGLVGVEQMARAELETLALPDHFQCMSKHLLESIVKTAQVGEHLAKASKDKKILSSYPISYSLVQGQILNLGKAREIDEATFEIHQKGIPIICNDVPPIPID